MGDDTATDDRRPECSRNGCDYIAVARWHDGMWTCEALCFEHVCESLDSRDDFDDHRDEVTTNANLTTIGSGRKKSRVVPAGAKPFSGPWACIRTVEALRHWIEQHDELVELKPDLIPDGGIEESGSERSHHCPSCGHRYDLGADKDLNCPKCGTEGHPRRSCEYRDGCQLQTNT